MGANRYSCCKNNDENIYFDVIPNILMLFAKKSFDAGVMFGFHIFLSDPGKPGVRSLGPDVRPSQTNY